MSANLSAGRPPLLAVDDLTVEFATPNGSFKAVDGVSFSMERGETLAVLGESGSGKSMTALAIMGIVPSPGGRITGGSVRLDGQELVGAPQATLRSVRGERVSMIFQDPLSSLNPVFTVGDQIAEMFRRHRHASRREAKLKAIELMKRVGIPDAANRATSYPHQFSGGMRQRVMIAMALALDPEILIADEPTTALDVTVQAQIIRLLKQLQDDLGMGLVLITHDLGVVASSADRVLVMYGGRVVESGPMRELYARSSHPYTLGLLESVPRLEQKAGRLTVIEGQPPSPLNLPSGCAFHTRCPFAEAVCRENVPSLRDVTLTQRSACHFAEQVAAGTKELTRVPVA